MVTFSLIQELECTLCGQMYKEVVRLEVAARLEMFGKTQYAVCLRCMQEVPEETMNDPLFRKKMDRFVGNKKHHSNWKKRR